MIVCLEGINASGKTTLARDLAAQWTSDTLTAQLIDPVQLTDFGQRVRGAIMDAPGLHADAETLAFVSARLTGAQTLDKAQVSADKLIILERWAGAVVAYGTVAGTNAFLLRALEAVLAGALPVDHTILLDVPGTVAANRLAALPEGNRFETNGSDYLERVRRQYLAWASMRHIRVLNGTLPTRDLAAQSRRLLGHVPAPSKETA